MEPTETKEDTATTESPLHPVLQVTTVSKYLALALFVVLPFLGGWIGYRYGTLSTYKVVSVETTTFALDQVLQPAETTTIFQTPQENDARIAFVSYNQGGWIGAWLLEQNGAGQWVKKVKVYDQYIASEAVVIGTKAFLNVVVTGEDSPGTESKVAVIDLLTNELSLLAATGTITNFIRSGDEILMYSLSDQRCGDYPSTYNRLGCVGTVFVLSSTSVMTTTDEFSQVPGAKQLVAFHPINKTIVLEDGYGDAGCVSSQFYTYSLNSREVVDTRSMSGCSEPFPDTASIDEYYQWLAEYQSKITAEFRYNAYQPRVPSVMRLDGVVTPHEGAVSIPDAYQITQFFSF